MSGLTILLVDDHPVVREGYRRLLERQPGFRVVAEAENATEAYRSYRETSPDLVIMDLTLPGAGGLEAVRHIRQWDKGARILVFTMHQSATMALKSFEAGAAGYVTKTSPPEELLRAVASLAAGRRALSADIAQDIADQRISNQSNPVQELAPRELEILRMFSAGMATEAIAEALCLSVKTVQNYHYQIKSKLGATTDAHLVWIAIGAGLLGETTIPLPDIRLKASP